MGEILMVENFIGGDFIPCSKHIDSFNPATGEVWAHIPDSGAHQVNEAVAAAQKAFPSWSRLSPSARAKYLLTIADIIDERLDELSLAESMDQGKPVWLAKQMDIPRASHNFRVFAESWQHLTESSNSMSGAGVINYSLRKPLGVAGLISPWNLPLYLLTFKIAPALMAGNTVVCKPSEMTSVTAWKLAQICKQIELPPGVLNMVFGYGQTAGEALVTHPKVRIVSFTGSTAVGQHIGRIAAPMMKKLSLELGGKNAAVVFDDADLEKCAQGLVRSAFLNQGEICLCTSRVFIQKGVYNKVLERFIQLTNELKTGDPTQADNFLGAVNSEVHYDKVMKYIKLSVEEGGTIRTGEGVSKLDLPEKNRKGWFVQPTIITGLSDQSRCMQDEIFGPVVCVTMFETEEEVIERVNQSRYGLCASVWSRDLGRVHRLGEELEVGTVWANCWLIRCLEMPFGGCKESGTGREGTVHSLEAFTQETTVCIKYKD